MICKYWFMEIEPTTTTKTRRDGDVTGIISGNDNIKASFIQGLQTPKGEFL